MYKWLDGGLKVNCAAWTINFSSIAMYVIQTYINRYRQRIPDGIHFIFWTRFERREKPDLSLYANAKQGSIWYHFYNVLGLNSRPPAYRANALTTEPPLFKPPTKRFFWVYARKNVYQPVKVLRCTFFTTSKCLGGCSTFYFVECLSSQNVLQLKLMAKSIITAGFWWMLYSVVLY